MQTESEWKEIARTAKRREIAMFALGVAAGLRWAKEGQNEAGLVFSIPLAQPAPKSEP
jgi:hypothetical protein